MDIYTWMVEQEQDLLYLVEQAYGSNEMIVIGEVTGFRTAVDSFVVEDENGNTCLVDFSEFEAAYLRAKKRRDEAEKALEKQLKNKKREV